MYNELELKAGYMLMKQEDNSYEMTEKKEIPTSVFHIIFF